MDMEPVCGRGHPGRRAMSVRDTITRGRRKAGRILTRSVLALTSPSATAAWIRPLMAVRRSFSSDRRSHLGKVNSILVIRLDAIGDVLMTGPFLRELRRAYPRAKISLIVGPGTANLVEKCPHIDRVLTNRVLTDRLPPLTRWWHPMSRRFVALSFARRHLWPARYDMAVVPRWGEDIYDASILALLSGAPCRVGYSARRPTKNGAYDRFYTLVVDDRSVRHEVERNLHLLSELRADVHDDALELWLSDEDKRVASRALASTGAEALVALSPGAGSPRRIWPIQRYVEVGHWLVDRGARLVVVGGPGDEGWGEELRRIGGDVIDLTNRTTVRETAAVLARCSLFCGSDSGPMHVAAAVGVPIVEVSCHPVSGDDLHPNSPKRFGPWGVPNRVVQPEAPKDDCAAGCRFEVPHCILNIRVDSVIAAIESLMVEKGVVSGQTDAF
jgi:ADP-heptose:LPS heptosyltransferase